MALAPAAMVPAALGATVFGSSVGSLAQRDDARNKNFDVAPALPWAALETGVNYLSLGVLGPLKNQVQHKIFQEILNPNAKK